MVKALKTLILKRKFFTITLRKLLIQELQGFCVEKQQLIFKIFPQKGFHKIH
ncbi:hypothetical protein PGT21_019223 [Puccinia graminis f. sp. tritici]|uniref:Uncharacterized protein n=1 Tax=Puccinia graminis f. sp. tritici TaxID=56615 RepID=A0A5B0P059_PUCGR|nr:hypothetical protein PGT21_019223 [Puccinia graminis f. sp. tritici]